MITTIKKQADINEPDILTGYLADGMLVPIAEGNRHYIEVQDAINGVGDYEDAPIVPEEAYTQAEIDDYVSAKKVSDVEAFVEGYIQAPITAYNEANLTNFGGIHNCRSYIGSTGYTHEQFCIDVWAFNVAVWEKVRAIQLDVLNGTIPEPTMEEFVAMLPVWGE